MRRRKEKTGKKTPFFGPRRHMLGESRIPDPDGIAEAGPNTLTLTDVKALAGYLWGSQAKVHGS